MSSTGEARRLIDQLHGQVTAQTDEIRQLRVELDGLLERMRRIENTQRQESGRR